MKATLRPSTYDSYAQHVACHIAPHVGAVKQQKLFGAQVNADSGLTFTAESDFGRRLSLPAADAVPTRT